MNAHVKMAASRLGAPSVEWSSEPWSRRVVLPRGAGSSHWPLLRRRVPWPCRNLKSVKMRASLSTKKVRCTRDCAGSRVKRVDGKVDLQELARLQVLISKLQETICSRPVRAPEEPNAYEQFRTWRANQARVRKATVEVANVLLHVRKEFEKA